METADAFDKIYDQIGHFGHHQILIFVIANLGDFATGFTIMLPVFIGRKPKEWICPPGNGSWTLNTTLGNATGNSSLNNATEKCESVCPGIQYTSDFTSIVTEWDLICDRDYIADLITTIQMIGVFFGAILISQLADTFGRKPVWYFTVLCNAIIGFSTAFAPSWEVFAAMRFFTGVCVGGLFIVNFIYPIEFIGIKWRPLCGALGFWPIAIMLLSPIAYGVREWRHLIMVTAPMPAVITVWLWCYLPESPRWLAMHSRLPEAEAVLKKIAEGNKRPCPENFELLKEFVKDVEAAPKYSYWDLFRTRSSTKYILILAFNWFVFSCVYYGLSLNVKNLPGDIYINNFLNGLVDWPAMLATIYFNNSIGRRMTMFIPLLIAGVAMFSVLFISVAGKLEELSVLVTVLALVGRLGDLAAWTVGYLYTAELFPTVIRNIACGTASMAGRIGGVVAPQFSYLDNVSTELPFIVFGVLAVVAALLGLMFPETKGKPLADKLPGWAWCRCLAGKEDTDAEADMDLNEKVDVQDNNEIEKTAL